MSLHRNQILYGRLEDLPASLPLRAGPLSLLLEEGALRSIRLGEREGLRRIYVAVRNRNWKTIAPRFLEVEQEIEADRFRIAYKVENREDEIDFRWQGTIVGENTGAIRFRMEGVAHSAFLRNRIGFCVLHPIRECAGQACRVMHSDGVVQVSRFPRLIAPHQLFLEMRSVAHEIEPGLWMQVELEGEVFETEDQRNWTDASFKTYGTPLHLPYPAEIREGARIVQEVRVMLVQEESGAETEKTPRANSLPAPTLFPSTPERLPGMPLPSTAFFSPNTGAEGDQGLAASPGNGERPITLTVGVPPLGMLPKIGLGTEAGSLLTDVEMNRLKRLDLSHLRVDIRLDRSDSSAELRRATDAATQLGIGLEIALFLRTSAQGMPQDLDTAVALARTLNPPVCRWLIFACDTRVTPGSLLHAARTALAPLTPQAAFGAGTDADFVFINRSAPPVTGSDFVTYSLNPQVHAFDNDSLMETLEAIPATLETARTFSGSLPLLVSPVTLRRRYNPDATGPEPPAAQRALPASVDARQMSLFGAAWTLGCLAALAQGGASAITFYETTGWCGVMERDEGSPLQEAFPSLPGAVFPLYHVLSAVGEFAGGQWLDLQASHPQRVTGLALKREDRTRILIANLTPVSQEIALHGLNTPLRVRHLDETDAEEAMRFPAAFQSAPGVLCQQANGALPMLLLPYAVACVDAVDEMPPGKIIKV